MTKAKAILIVIAMVAILYLMLSVFIVFLADTTVSVNADLAAAHNMARYPGTSGFLLSTPWIMYTVPGVLGIVLIVLILKRKDANV